MPSGANVPFDGNVSAFDNVGNAQWHTQKSRKRIKGLRTPLIHCWHPSSMWVSETCGFVEIIQMLCVSPVTCFLFSVFKDGAEWKNEKLTSTLFQNTFGRKNPQYPPWQGRARRSFLFSSLLEKRKYLLKFLQGFFSRGTPLGLWWFFRLSEQRRRRWRKRRRGQVKLAGRVVYVRVCVCLCLCVRAPVSLWMRWRGGESHLQNHFVLSLCWGIKEQIH